MIEYDRAKQQSFAEKPVLRICVAGVGGAGSNVLDRITMDRTIDADLVCFHTDVRVLSHGMAPNKVQLGGDLMKGVGAGGDPDLGREAALFSKEQIRQAVSGHEIVFICTGLGGGTGSGAAPVVAEIAKGAGALVVVLATMPFSFEGRRRLGQAEEALELLQKRADALVLFENNRMGELVLPKEGIQKAFSLADQTIAQCARAVAAMVSTPGLVKLGLDDLMSALNASNGRCLFGFGEAKGQSRGADALKKALKSPLIDQGRLLQQTKNLLVHIVGGESLTLMEVDGIMKQLGRSVPEETQILFGLAVDSKLNDSISVTLISSLGLEQLAVKPVMVEDIAGATRPAAPERKMAVTSAPPAPPPLPQAAAPMPADEVAAPKDEPMELFGSYDPPASPFAPPGETSAKSVREPAEPETKQEPAPATARTEPAAKDQDEDEEEEKLQEAPAAKASRAHTPAPPSETPPPPPPRHTRKAETDAGHASRGVLAAVLSNPTTISAPVSPAAEVDEEHHEELAVAGASSQPGFAQQATAASGEQQTFSLGGENRGRFKDTEPSLADGEDLDVPTWMRLRKKLKR